MEDNVGNTLTRKVGKIAVLCWNESDRRMAIICWLTSSGGMTSISWNWNAGIFKKKADIAEKYCFKDLFQQIIHTLSNFIFLTSKVFFDDIQQKTVDFLTLILDGKGFLKKNGNESQIGKPAIFCRFGLFLLCLPRNIYRNSDQVLLISIYFLVSLLTSMYRKFNQKMLKNNTYTHISHIEYLTVFSWNSSLLPCSFCCFCRCPWPSWWP